MTDDHGRGVEGDGSRWRVQGTHEAWVSGPRREAACGLTHS